MKVNKFLTLLLTIVSFVSGVVVAFEWMGHDRGQRVYSMLKRPEIKEVEVVKEVRIPIVISDDSIILAINQNYRDVMIKISGMEFNGNGARPEKDFQKIQGYINEALEFPETMIREEK